MKYIVKLTSKQIMDLVDAIRIGQKLSERLNLPSVLTSSRIEDTINDLMNARADTDEVFGDMDEV